MACMPAPVSLPRQSWGDPASPRTALLVHGLGSNGALMWRFASTLADLGWSVTAIDLRGHGLAPRALNYSIAAYAVDLGATRPASGSWDLVVAHSLGGAAATVAAATDPAWTKRLVLIDPAIQLSQRNHDLIRASQLRSFEDPRVAAVTAEHPNWHPQDAELKVLSVEQASHWAVIATMDQNTVWDVRADAARLQTPTHVIAGDPKVYSIFRGDLAEEVLRNGNITMSVVPGAGHSPHRDRPEETMRQLVAALS